jgi:hypothetical protein
VLLAMLATLIAAAGCGDSDSDSDDQNRLIASQANSSIQLFCARATLRSTAKETYNVGLIAMVDAVNQLIAMRREDPQMKVPLDTAHLDVPIEKVVRDSLVTLKRNCGPDGKLAAQRLERGVTQTGQ